MSAILVAKDFLHAVRPSSATANSSQFKWSLTGVRLLLESSVYRRIANRGCLNPRIAQSRSLHVEGIGNIMGGVIDFTSLFFFFLNKNIVFLAQAEVIILFSADFRQNILNYSFLMKNILVERSTLNQYA